MPRPLKVLGGIFIGALVLVAVLLVVVYSVGGRWMSERHQVEVDAVPVPTDPESIEWGKHIVEAIGACTGCHAEDLGGMVLVDSPAFARWLPPNLTSGEGGVGSAYTDEDWVRAIRHGIARDGRGLIMMPSTGYYHFSDADVGAIIAYLKSVPPVDRTMEASTLNLFGRVAMVMGAPFVYSRELDHDAPRLPRPEAAVSVAYGDYLARVCAVCHGVGLAGSIGPDLRPRGGYSHVDAAEFVEIMRTGINTAGQQMNPQDMPWPNFARLTDLELAAIWTYLESLPGD